MTCLWKKEITRYYYDPNSAVTSEWVEVRTMCGIIRNRLNYVYDVSEDPVKVTCLDCRATREYKRKLERNEWLPAEVAIADQFRE